MRLYRLETKDGKGVYSVQPLGGMITQLQAYDNYPSMSTEFSTYLPQVKRHLIEQYPLPYWFCACISIYDLIDWFRPALNDPTTYTELINNGAMVVTYTVPVDFICFGSRHVIFVKDRSRLSSKGALESVNLSMSWF